MPTKAGTKRGTKKRSKAGTKRATKSTRKTTVNKSLSTSYRGTPNTYSFIRETRPTYVDVGTIGNGVTLIEGTGTIPNIARFDFGGFEINQVPAWTDFSSLFANYKIDRIDTFLIPMWQSTDNPNGVGSGPLQLPNLMITRVNTKFLPGGLASQATAEAQRDQLAQIVKKSRSLYGSRKWLKVSTTNPRVQTLVEDGAGGTNIVAKNTPWLPTVDASDQQYVMNDSFFVDTLNGEDIDGPEIYMYRMYHRVHFRCSFVG